MTRQINPLLCADFYKTDHPRQYPEGTEYVYSNFTPRSDRLAKTGPFYDGRMVFFGLQAFLMENLINTWDNGFFKLDEDKVCDEYQEFLDQSLGEGAVPTDHIRALHKLGYLPLEVRALPEGSLVGMQVPVFTVVNTKPEFFWLTNYLETWFSNEIWKTCTSATTAHEYRKIIEHYSDLTGGSKDVLDIQCHDFSCRGMSGMQDAAWSGMGHLTSFIGTDTMLAIDYARYYYGPTVGVSVPATEHSVMCMGGEDDEIGTFKRLITELYPTGIVSIVSDTWDFWQVITEFTVKLKDEIMSRQPDAMGFNKVVFRPDSGDPVKIICGIPTYDFHEGDVKIEDLSLRDLYSEGIRVIKHEGKYWDLKQDIRAGMYHWRDESELTESEIKGAVECLWDVFGGETNESGYRTLDQHVGLIYGDSITLERADEILHQLAEKGFASDNIVFGVGSYTYQHVTRDTYGFAMKATWGVVDGEPRMIKKEPKTDKGKTSATGLMSVIKDESGAFILKDGMLTTDEQGELSIHDELHTVFLDGELYNTQTMDEIRSRIKEV